MTKKPSQNLPLGYFKIKASKLPAPPSAFRSIFSADRRLTEMLQQSKPVIVVPAIGFTLAILLLTGVQTGVLVAKRIPDNFFVQALVDSNLAFNRYQALATITLPVSVSFLVPVYDQGVDWVDSFGQGFSILWSKIIKKIVPLLILTKSLFVE